MGTVGTAPPSPFPRGKVGMGVTSFKLALIANIDFVGVQRAVLVNILSG